MSQRPTLTSKQTKLLFFLLIFLGLLTSTFIEKLVPDTVGNTKVFGVFFIVAIIILSTSALIFAIPLYFRSATWHYEKAKECSARKDSFGAISNLGLVIMDVFILAFGLGLTIFILLPLFI